MYVCSTCIYLYLKYQYIHQYQVSNPIYIHVQKKYMYLFYFVLYYFCLLYTLYTRYELYVYAPIYF